MGGDLEMRLLVEGERDELSHRSQPVPSVNMPVIQVAFLVPLLIAAVLRFGSLNILPLSDSEASNGLAALGLGNEMYSPAYATLTGVLFSLVGGSDTLARFLPALAGVVLVITPYFLRRIIGDFGALVAGMLLAVSPSLTAVSRTASGDSFALLALAVIAVSWLNGRKFGDPKWGRGVAIGLGVGLTTSALFYAGLIMFGLTWVFAGSLLDEEVTERRAWESADYLPWLVGSFLGAGTLFLLKFNQIGAIFSLPIELVANVNVSSIFTMMQPLLLIGRYEIAVFSLALISVIWVTVANRRFGLLLTYSLTISMIVSLLQANQIETITLVTVPTALLLGLTVQRLYGNHEGSFPFVLVLLILIPLFGAVLQIGRFVQINRQITSLNELFGESGLVDANSILYLLLVVVMTLILLAILTRAYAQSISGMWLGIGSAILLAYIIFQWGTAWWLGHAGQNDVRSGWVDHTAVDTDILLFEETLINLYANQQVGPPTPQLFSTINTPLLRWYMRHFPNTTFGETMPPNPDYDFIISDNLVVTETVAQSYAGTQFDYLRRPVGLDAQETILHRWRWWFFRSAPQQDVAEKLILWVKPPAINTEPLSQN